MHYKNKMIGSPPPADIIVTPILNPTTPLTVVTKKNFISTFICCLLLYLPITMATSATRITTTTTSQWILDSTTTYDNTNIFAAPSVSQSFNRTTTLETTRHARINILALIDEYWQSNQILLPSKFLRLAFHDSIGGMDGCVDLANLHNYCLQIHIDALQQIVQKYKQRSYSSTDVDVVGLSLSCAEIWALVYLISVETKPNPPNKLIPPSNTSDASITTILPPPLPRFFATPIVKSPPAPPRDHTAPSPHPN